MLYYRKIFSTYFIFILVLILIYSNGIITRIGLSEFYSKILVEICILFMILSVLRKTNLFIVPGWLFVTLFGLLTILSGFVSGDGIYVSLIYFRMEVYAFLVFWTVWNAQLSSSQIFNLNKLIVLLWCAQIVASSVYVFIFNERIESHVGTITAGAGSPATVFPLFAMVYFLAFYCYYNRSIWILLIALSFAFVGYASGKRAIYFFLPAVYLTVFVWYFFLERNLIKRISNFFVPVIVFLICVPVLVYGLTQSKRFSHLEGAEIGTVVNQSISVVKEYDSRILPGGEISGRTANSKALLKRLFGENWHRYLLGLGPGSMRNIGNERGKITEGIAYGAVGWVENTISVGWPAMLANIGFYILIWFKLFKRRLQANSPDYEKALYFGCHLGFFVYFLMYFTYTYSYAMAGWLTFVQVYFAAILLSPRHRGKLQNYQKKKFVVRWGPEKPVLLKGDRWW